MLNIIETLNTIYQITGIAIIFLMIFYMIFSRKNLKNNLIRNIKIRIAICIILSMIYLIYICAAIMLKKSIILITLDIITMLILEVNADTAIKDLKILKKD